ncbi:flagellar protein FliT [Pantoea allii]|uniref:Flagellar protein FliT n=1 Tax=Pantoea allii TaxID=574096 RepID=A0ABS6V8Q4_9GAMM|nr:flagellar protein FliT [Pantoea allii]MBW1212680.1 flagella biosynthesis regulatory protein FliT [Pantoea allii]MBW1255682.1 flagella biosynthesis regulatory protein FliT [Pantoea allii]MBW1264759.1 flagella biosynthesis regulatory protein FliT [Pantoea allii]MBW1286876.1 flagella biosynthesis regulatory protein FliT [Pantoea allii]NQS85298.1 flagella biosynthesis regulatory protein FliT [Pantoea allii]
MSNPLELLKGYQQLLTLSNAMLEHARQGQWDELLSCESTYISSVERVARDNDADILSALQRAQIRPLLEQILRNETTLKTLLGERMHELRSLVTTSTQQQNVMTSYGNMAGNILYPKSQ